MINILKKCPDKVYNIITLFLTAVCIRLFYCLERPWFAGDSDNYIDLAKNIYYHHSFAFSGSNQELIATAFRPMLYPVLMALTGVSLETYKYLFIVQCILGAITVILIYLMAYDAFGRFVALFSALMLTFAPMTIHYTATIMTETLFTFLIVLVFFLGSKGIYYVAGIGFGLAALTRPIIFPFFLFLSVLIVIFPMMRNQWKHYLMVFSLAILISLPWMVRNSLLYNKVTLTQSSGYGTNLLYGTIETPLWGDDVWTWIMKHPLAQPTEGLDEIAQDRLRMKVALNRIKENPVQWLKTRSKQYPKLFLDSGDYVLGEYNLSVNQSVKENKYWILLFKVVFICGNLLFYGLCILGFIFAGKKILLLPQVFLFPFFLAIIHLPMWIETRYFLSAVPFVCIISAFCVQQILLKQNIIKFDKRFLK